MTEENTAPEAGTAKRRVPAPLVMEALSTVAWAITPEWLETMRAIVARENFIEPEALEAYRARRVAGTDDMSVRGGVAILPVRGPLFRYADFFTSISGATTYEGLRRDLQTALDDPSVRAILPVIDSPGGEVNGMAELAAAFRQADAVKPVVAYVSGTGASAAYLLAASAREIVASETSVLGSIGVRMGLRDTSERDAKSGVKIIEFISSQSPNKRTDPYSDEGRGKIQKTVDQLAAVFVSAVAQYRGVTEEEVISKFGAGGVEVGAAAVEVGLADRIGSFEGVLAELSTGRTSARRQGKGKQAMSDKTNTTATAEETVTKTAHDAAVATARAEGEKAGAASAQTRIKAILASDEAKNRRTLAEHFAFNTTMSAEDVSAALKVAPEDKPAEPAPAATAPPATGPRAKDATGGLAVASATGAGTKTDETAASGTPKAVTIDHQAIYKRFSGGRR